MEEFSPIRGYDPKDEYESVEAAPKASEAPAPSTDIPQEPQPVSAPDPVQPAYDPGDCIPQYRPYQQAYTGYPAQPTYPQPPYPPYAPPVEMPDRPAVQPYDRPIGAPAPLQSQYQTQPQQGYPAGYVPYRQQPAPQQAPYQHPVPPMSVQQPYSQPPVPQDQSPYGRNPYAQADSFDTAYQPSAPQQKPSTPTGTKAFIIILCALLVAMIGGFITYVAVTANSRNKTDNDSRSFDYSIGDDDSRDGANGFDPFGGSNSITGFTDVEDEITLQEDKGDTQKRDDDNTDSVGEPDEKAEGITLKELPKDKDDAKYTAQSAYESVCDSVVTVICYQDEITDSEEDIISQGTGTIISADGYLITNAHVIGNSRAFAVNIVLNNGDKHQAKIIGYDTWTDLAVLKIDAKDLKPVTFGDSELINVGDEVIAIGSPGGVKFQNSLTKGIVSAVDREISINKYVRYIQSDAAISPGNSGGPLCNIYGQVIGITTAKTIATNYENMSFSIPSETVEEIIGDLIHHGYVQGRTRLGLTGSAISQEEVIYYGLPAGIEISAIDENGPLADSNLQPGDILTELDGQEITSFQDIYDVLADHDPGDKVTIKAVRPKQ